MEWASRITTIAAEMAVPPVLGYLLDQRLGTKPLFAALGGIFGLAGGMWSLLQLTKPKPPEQDP
jgi:F0F1-type ATP synthase assembly protein I